MFLLDLISWHFFKSKEPTSEQNLRHPTSNRILKLHYPIVHQPIRIRREALLGITMKNRRTDRRLTTAVKATVYTTNTGKEGKEDQKITRLIGLLKSAAPCTGIECTIHWNIWTNQTERGCMSCPCRWRNADFLDIRTYVIRSRVRFTLRFIVVTSQQ